MRFIVAIILAILWLVVSIPLTIVVIVWEMAELNAKQLYLWFEKGSSNGTDQS